MNKQTVFGICIVFLIYFVSGIVTFLGESDISINPFDYARITDVDYKAIVDDEENGSALITERLTYDVHAASRYNRFWELWRDLSEDNYDGLKVDYDVISVSQIIDGKEVSWPESSRLYWADADYSSIGTRQGFGPGKWFHSPGPYNENARRYEAVFFYIPGVYRDTMTFEVKYRMNNAVLKYRDCSEIYLSMYSEDTINFLKSYKAQILFPDNKMPKAGNYVVHTFGTNDEGFPYSESDNMNPGYHTFSFNLNKNDLKFNKTNEFIEFSLISMNEDKDIFSQSANTNLYTDEDTLDELLEDQENYDKKATLKKEAKIIAFAIFIILTIAEIIKALFLDKVIRYQHNFYKPENEIIYYRDIPDDLDPIFAAKFAFCKNKHKEKEDDLYSSILLSLVRKNYVELQKIAAIGDWVDSNIKIIVKHVPINLKEKLELSSMEEISEFVSKKTDNMYSNNNLDHESLADKYLEKYVIKNEEEFAKQDLEKAALSDINNFDNISNTDNSIQDYSFESVNNKIEDMNYESLTINEKAFFELILKYTARGMNELTMAKFQENVSFDYEMVHSFVKEIDNSIHTIGIDKRYFQKEGYDQVEKNLKLKGWGKIIRAGIYATVGNVFLFYSPVGFAYGSLTLLSIVLALNGIYHIVKAKDYILLTEKGETEYEKWYGLYNFLNSETLMKERTVVELPLWEKYLVYATAFGISKKVVDAIKIRCPDAERSVILNSHSCYRSVHFNNMSHSFTRSVHSGSYGSSSYGSGGGYGGGGRGGGGGRRRSLKTKQKWNENSTFLF